MHRSSSSSAQILLLSKLFISSVMCFVGSQHPSPNVKSLCNFETQIRLEIITSRDAKSACFKGSQTSCREIISGVFLPKFGRKGPHHVMDACCWFWSEGREGGHCPSDPDSYNTGLLGILHMTRGPQLQLVLVILWNWASFEFWDATWHLPCAYSKSHVQFTGIPSWPKLLQNKSLKQIVL